MVDSWLLPPKGLLNQNDCFTVIGFGSLVDPGWAKETMPNLANFRTGKVLDFCRVFNLVSIVNIKRGYAKEPYLATCTAVRKLGSLLLVSLFEVPRSEYAAFARREIRLRHEVVDYVEEGKVTGKGVLCTEFSDEEYFLNRCQGDPSVYFSEVGQFYRGKLYRDDILPVPRYLSAVLAAHESLGPDFRENLLDASFLADGTTRIRDYLEVTPQALQDPPPDPP